MPHAHFFLKSGESEGTTGVTFTLYWELRTKTATTSGSDTISATSAELLANAHQIYKQGSTGFATPTVDDDVGSQITLRIARTAGDAGDVVVTTYGIHYPVDMLGSDTAVAKFA